MGRFPARISETLPFDPMIGQRPFGFRSRYSKRKATISLGLDLRREEYVEAS